MTALIVIIAFLLFFGLIIYLEKTKIVEDKDGNLITSRCFKGNEIYSKKNNEIPKKIIIEKANLYYEKKLFPTLY
jgi:hypothetical protein